MRLTLNLQDDLVDVWVVPVDLVEPSKLISFLDTAEKDRANRLLRDHDRNRYIAAHAALRLVLSQYLQERPETLSFRQGNHGKPALSKGNGVEFNLSHSGNMALIAVGLTHPVGVDIEHMEGNAVEAIDSMALSQTERRYLMQMSNVDRVSSAFQYWTRKEAYAKVSGKGLSEEFQALTCLGPVGIVNGTRIEDLFLGHADYAAAVAREGSGWRASLHSLDATTVADIWKQP